MFIDNAVQALIPFKEGHGSVLKLHIHLGEGVWMLGEKQKNFLRGGRKMYGEAIQNLLRYCLSYGALKEGKWVLMRKKLGRQ